MNAVPPLLEVRDLEKLFPVSGGPFRRPAAWVRAVDGVSFVIEQGETLAIVGESGCGKTTLAKLILRLELPSAGHVSVEGQNVHQLRGRALQEFRSKVQAVFQDPWASLNPRMRIRDIVAEPLIVNRRLPRSAVRVKVLEALQAVGLRPEHAANFPHEFSGGQRQRVSIASALISEPRLILLDEPVSALDVSIRSQIMNLFKDLQVKYGMSYLLIAHDLATTRFMADHMAVMYLGRIVEHAPSEVLFERPKHPYTRALLAAALPARPGPMAESDIVEGEVPSPINPPSGCTFHTRCPVKIGRICETVEPALEPKEGLGVVACHLYSRIPSAPTVAAAAKMTADPQPT